MHLVAFAAVTAKPSKQQAIVVEVSLSPSPQSRLTPCLTNDILREYENRNWGFTMDELMKIANK
ncbi:hypothetical protein Hdeb2414_s0009g00325231 [Helianthus debilis subsp. tardiflorus]